MKHFIKKHKTKLFIFACGLFFGIAGVAAATTIFASSEVSYSNSNMNATNVKDAIDELYTKTGSCSSSAGLKTVYAYHTDQKIIYFSELTSSEYENSYTKLSTYKSGKSYFLKYEINSNNVIQKAYACMKFSFISSPVCMQFGGEGSAYYASNQAILNSLQSTFNSNGDSCDLGRSSSSCGGSNYAIVASSNGDVAASASKKGCQVASGKASCSS